MAKIIATAKVSLFRTDLNDLKTNADALQVDATRLGFESVRARY